MLAVENGHVDTVLYLIANSAIVNARDIHGHTALHRGVSHLKVNSLTDKKIIALSKLKPFTAELQIFFKIGGPG